MGARKKAPQQYFAFGRNVGATVGILAANSFQGTAWE